MKKYKLLRLSVHYALCDFLIKHYFQKFFFFCRSLSIYMNNQFDFVNCEGHGTSTYTRRAREKKKHVNTCTHTLQFEYNTSASHVREIFAERFILRKRRKNNEMFLLLDIAKQIR